MNNLSDLDIDLIIKNNKSFRFTNELQNTSDIKRKNDINQILDYLNGVKKTEDDAKTLLDEVYKGFEDYSMKKKWARLQPIQKITKIKEYICENVKDKKECKKIEDFAIELINNGKLKTAKDVVYDQITAKITEINVLKDKIVEATKKINNALLKNIKKDVSSSEEENSQSDYDSVFTDDSD